ncbi:general transcription factor 3C polypeptide 2-like isoform X1 [Haliotis rufescens]|uniref:general transcription factor 3C polypeptide 2-like isoform X1 n=1 Tax=Haliotis rufescens TaxID=6454 RepID=UPI00201F63E5|nr:general transcription factor 3C polypeptide 2-like isoform X1 [Haliotis rufescens]
MVRRTPRSGKNKKDTSAEINEDSFEKAKKGKQTSSKGSGPKPRRSAEVSISPIKSPAAEKDEELIESEAPDENEADSPQRDGGPSKEDLLSSLALSDKKKLKAKEDEEKQLPKIRSSKRTRMPNVRLEDQEKSEDSNNKKKSVKKDGSNSAGKDKSNPSVKKTELSGSPKPAYISDFDDGAGEESVKNKSKEQQSKDESLNDKNNHDREDVTPKLKKRKGKETKKQSKTKGDNSVEVQDTSVNDSNTVNTSRGKLKGIVDKEKEEDSLDESFDATTLPTSTPLPSRGRGRGRGRPRGSRGRGRGRGAYRREKGDDENNSSRHSTSVDGDSSISFRTSSRKRKAKKYCDDIELGSDIASDSNGSDEEEEEEEEDSKKKKTKRRKVNVSDEDSTSEVSTVGRKPKGRGKKRSLDESCELEYTPVAKRGRPRKTPTIQIKSPEIVQASTLCTRCDKDLITLAGLKFHLMTEHQALWAKDCPEGKTDIAALKRIMKAQGKLVCQKCRKELRHYHYYVHHIQWCGREEERTVCEVCGRSQKSMWYHAHLVYHKKRDNDEEKFKVQEEKDQKEKEEGGEDLNKLGKKKRKSAKKAMQTLAEIGADEKKTSRSGRRKGDSEDDYSGAEDSDVDRDFQGSGDEEEEEDDDDADHEIEDNEGVTTKDKVKMKKSYRSYTTNSPYFSDHPDFFLEILAAKEQEDNNVLFPKLIPRNNNWKELPTEEAGSYMTDRNSHPFVVKRGNDKNDAKQLRISECITSTGHSTCYTGYSVWGLAWCPVPFKKTANQIAAVSCNLTSDHATNKTFSEPAVVQIWDFGELTCNNSSTPDPKLAFSIGHDYGSVWQVCWCPKGVWEEPVVTLDNTKEDFPRLGLLALGCSDGTVRIFSIPHPQFLAATSDVYFPTEEQIQRERTPPVYKAQPCLTLTSRPNSDTGSCLCVDWQKAGGSQFILAGYSQGCVQVYDLITTSPLLRVLNNTVESIFPSRAFPAHLRAVTGCSWSETVPSCFSTAGRDKVVMFWDMDNPNRPYDKWLSSDMGMLTSIKWASRVYNGVVTAQDDCLHLAHNTSYYQETGFSGLHGFFDKALCVHNSVVWDVTYSPHFNVLLSCDGSGCVVAVKTVDLRIPSSKFTKGTPRSKAILYTTHITSPSAEEKSEAESPSEESDQPCIEFSDSEHMSHIRALNSKDDTGYKMPSISVGAIDAAPLQSVYRISVNPNLESCTWILSGGEAGFLRLHNLCGMLTSTAKTELGIS